MILNLYAYILKNIPGFNSTPNESVNDFAVDFNDILPTLILKYKKINEEIHA